MVQLKIKSQFLSFIKSNENKGEMMKKLTFTYWQDGKFWLGYLNDYPEYMTQGMSFDELKKMLEDIYKDIESGVVNGMRKQAEIILDEA